MVSTKPYFLRAIFEWCVDQGFTPYVTVAVNGQTRVPREFVRDGQIVLNVGPDATHQLQMGNDEISFQARFNGVAFPVVVPIQTVLAIYAKENGQGMAFDMNPDESSVAEQPAEDAISDASAPELSPSPSPPGRPKLTRVK